MNYLWQKNKWKTYTLEHESNYVLKPDKKGTSGEQVKTTPTQVKKNQAESLSKVEWDLELNGLTTITDQKAEISSKVDVLSLGLTSPT